MNNTNTIDTSFRKSKFHKSDIGDPAKISVKTENIYFIIENPVMQFLNYFHFENSKSLTITVPSMHLKKLSSPSFEKFGRSGSYYILCRTNPFSVHRVSRLVRIVNIILLTDWAIRKILLELESMNLHKNI